MLDLFSVANFKSFALADLPLSELTVLVGANASGKSNLIEGLQLLAWLAQGRRLHDLQSSLRDHELVLRGTAIELTRVANAPIQLFANLRGNDELGPLRLSISLGSRAGQPGLSVLEEVLEAKELNSSLPLYGATSADGLSGTLKVSYNNFARGANKPEINAIDQQAVFTQLTTPARFDAKHERAIDVIPRAARTVQSTLEAIRFLDPNPARMRSYAFKTDTVLVSSGENVSAALFEACRDPRGKEAVLDFVRALPEQHITDITFLETPRNEVMVQLWERFGAGQPTPFDAALLSDGTLRVLAIAASLLSAPKGSLVVIEEIDNGVHPSRAQHLVETIRKTAGARGVRVLLTTHNPALMNALPVEVLASVVVCYRDEAGNSRLVKLEDVPRYPELIAQGRLGDVATSGLLERFVKQSPNAYSYEPFFDLLKASDGNA